MFFGICVDRMYHLGLVSNTASRPHAEQWRSDTIKGLSLAEDSNGTKGYVFVGESLDYLLTTGGGEVVKMLNDPAIHGEKSPFLITRNLF